MILGIKRFRVVPHMAVFGHFDLYVPYAGRGWQKMGVVGGCGHQVAQNVLKLCFYDSWDQDLSFGTPQV